MRSPVDRPARRAGRRARTEKVRNRRLKTLKAVALVPVPCTPRTVGQMRTKAPFDCGRPRCGVCHPAKKWKAKSERVRRRVEGRAEAREGARTA